MRYFSMFSGIGGFELGIQKAYSKIESRRGSDCEGGTSQHSGRPLCVGFSEVNKYAVKVYESHFKGHKNYGDATRIVPEELPDFDLLVGGFPCQAFSIAGKRLGFEDTRGTLFFDIARILKSKRPRMFVLENVKGLLSHDNGRTFKVIISTLAEMGYCVEWQVLNSKNFGVPQNRERVFIIGHLGGSSGRQVFPIGEDGRKDLELCRQQNTANTITTRYEGGGRSSMTKKHNWDSYPIKGRIRRLTPVECARLQGFPDNWHKGIVSDSQAYKCYGNAVTVNVIQAIMEKIMNPHMRRG